jgi:hypothetical protein
MDKETQTSIKEAAAVLEDTLDRLGCSAPIELIENDTAIRVGSISDSLVVRLAGNLWQVSEHTPYLQSISLYHALEECACDIAMCRPGFVLDHGDLQVKEIG